MVGGMKNTETHMTVARIFDAVGRSCLTSQLGVGRTSVSNAIGDNVMPPRWFDVVERACRSKDIECPRHLFSFTANKERGAA